MKTIQKIRDYVLEDLIGEGGMGAVYRARHVLLDRTVAIKVMSDELLADAEFEARFVREAKAQGRLHHPYIVGVSDFFAENGRYYLVMPLVEGRSLEDHFLIKGKPLPLPEALSISADVLSALDYAHQHGVIHRDVKPSNILLDANGHAHLVDFGIALMVGFDRRTRTGTTIGTPHYMSPEQIRRPRDLDHRTDVYSFGCVLYEMVTGHPPFEANDDEGDTDFVVKEGHVSRQPVAPRLKNAAVPAVLNDIILRTLSKQPDERFSGCGEFARALAGMANSLDVPNGSSPLKPAPRLPLFEWFKRPVWRLSLILGVVALLAVIVMIVFGHQRDHQNAEVNNSKGLALFEQKKFAEAEAAYRQAVALDPKNALYHDNLGRALYSQKKYAEAEAECRQALALDPNSPDYNNDLGKALMDQDKQKEAEAEFRQALALLPKEARYHNNLGLVLEKQQRYPEAEAEYKQAIALDPNDGRYHNNFGNYLKNRQKYSEAEAEYRKAIAINPKAAMYHDGLGTALEAQGYHYAAESSFRKAITLEPDEAYYYFHLGIALSSRHNNAEAESVDRQAIALDPNVAQYHNSLGVDLKAQEKYADAEAAFRKAIELDANESLYHNNLGETLDELGNYADAEAAFRKAIALDSNKAFYHDDLALVLLKQEKYVDAEAEERQAVALDPKNARYHNNLGAALQDQQRYSDAESEYRRAVAFDSSEARYHCNLGRMLENRQEYAVAEQEFKAALALKSDYTLAQDHLNAVQEKMRSRR